MPGPGLAISGVSRTYRTEEGPVAALGPVELHVPQGRFVTLIGPSGCGKSTLLRVLAGIERPDQGSISIFGESVEHTRRAKLIGFVPQALALLPWRTVLENARVPLELNRSGGANRRKPARARARYFERSVSAMSSTAGPLSCRGGCDNVLPSRAFVSEPALLLMDEPFSALDELTSEVLRRELLQLWHSTRTTVLFVSHSVSEAVLLSDHVVVMTPAPGRVATVIDVTLERPRGDLVEVTDAFRDCEREVRLALRGTLVPDQQAP